METTRAWELKAHLQFKFMATSCNSNDPEFGRAYFIGWDLAGQGRGAGLGIDWLQARARISFYNRSTSICVEPAEHSAIRLYFISRDNQRGGDDRRSCQRRAGNECDQECYSEVEREAEGGLEEERRRRAEAAVRSRGHGNGVSVMLFKPPREFLDMAGSPPKFKLKSLSLCDVLF